MPRIIWTIVAVVFGLPLLVLLGLWLSNRFGKGSTAGAINLLWALLAVLLVIFLGLALFTGVK